MKISMLSAALAALSLSQVAFGGKPKSWLYTDDSTCGAGPNGQPTDPALVSDDFNINNQDCHQQAEDRKYFWKPKTKSQAPHCLHMSYAEDCSDNPESQTFNADGSCLAISRGANGKWGSYWYTQGSCSPPSGPDHDPEAPVEETENR